MSEYESGVYMIIVVYRVSMYIAKSRRSVYAIVLYTYSTVDQDIYVRIRIRHIYDYSCIVLVCIAKSRRSVYAMSRIIYMHI